MKHRPLLGLLLVAPLGLARPTTLHGQTSYIPPSHRPQAGSNLKSLAIPLHPSHRRLGDMPPGFGDAENAVSDRIRGAHRGREKQDLVQKLRNPTFMHELSGRAGLTVEDINAFREKLTGAQKIADDPTWKLLLRQAVSDDRLSREQVEILQEWAKEHDNLLDPDTSSSRRHPPNSATGPVDNSSGEPNAPSPTSGAEDPAKPPRPENFWDWSGQQVKDATTGLINSVGEALDSDDSPDGRSLRNAIRQFRSGGFKSNGAGLDLTQFAPGLAGYLPDLRQLVSVERLSPRGLTSLFRNARLPNVSRLGRRSLPSVPHGSASGLGEGLLWIAMLLALGAVLWKALARVRGEEVGESAQRWRLGPWPVAPEAVSTRAELIAAFEHLALLRLGWPARVYNHLEVADRLAGAAGDDARVRRAAAELARLYEQARYAPAEESLSDEELAAGRRDLCFLAGVASA